MARELEARPVIVTGAGQGLGRAYALAIARAGGKLVVNDLNGPNVDQVVDEIRAAGGEAVPCVAAVGSEETARLLVQTALDSFGSLYGLINNAAALNEAPSIDEDPGRVETMVRANVLGTWYTGVEAMKLMRRQGRGVVVNIASGAMLGVPGLAIYGATKAASHSLTLSWAKELEGSGVRVHGISPWALTPMLQSSSPEKWAKHGPEVAAPLAVYLLSDDAIFLHGQLVRTAEGQISLYENGTYGPVLGENFDWTNETLHAALKGAGTLEVKGFVPQQANG